MTSDDTADVVILLQWFPGFTSTQNWKIQSQYSNKNSPNNFEKLIGENAKITENYWSPAVICSPKLNRLVFQNKPCS